MTIRLFRYAIATILLTSCTPTDQGQYHSYHYGVKDEMKIIEPTELSSDNAEQIVLPIADPRGVNMQMMDNRLQLMVNEADQIELQVAALSERLKQLRNDIAGLSLINKVTVAADPYAGSADLPLTERTGSSANNIPSDKTPKTVPLSEPAEKAQKPQMEQPKPIAVQKVEDTRIQTSNTSKDGIINVRYGVHPDKTRIVFDVNGTATNTYNFDKEAGIVTVSMPSSAWNTTANRTYNLNQLSGYEAQKSENGTVVAMAVKNTTSVKSEVIPATRGKPARLIIDLIK